MVEVPLTAVCLDPAAHSMGSLPGLGGGRLAAIASAVCGPGHGSCHGSSRVL